MDGNNNNQSFSEKAKKVLFGWVSFVLSVFSLIAFLFGAYFLLARPAQETDIKLNEIVARIEKDEALSDQLQTIKNNDLQEIKLRQQQELDLIVQVEKDIVRLQTLLEQHMKEK